MIKVGQIIGFASHYTAFPHSNERRVYRERCTIDPSLDRKSITRVTRRDCTFCLADVDEIFLHSTT